MASLTVTTGFTSDPRFCFPDGTLIMLGVDRLVHNPGAERSLFEDGYSIYTTDVPPVIEVPPNDHFDVDFNYIITCINPVGEQVWRYTFKMPTTDSELFADLLEAPADLDSIGA